MLVFEGVSRRFGAAYALREVDLRIEPGRLTVLTGPNGAGKSTSLRLAATLDRPTQGRVLIAGEDVRADGVAARRHLAWLGDEPGLPDELTLRETLRLHASFFGHEAALDEAARTMGIAHRLDERARHLSRGERQRGALARALLGGGLMLLDEPTHALDAQGAQAALEALLAARGKRTILAATHDPELIKRADHVLRLEGGRLA